MQTLMERGREIFDLEKFNISKELFETYLREIRNGSFLDIYFDREIQDNINILTDMMLKAVDIPIQLFEEPITMNRLQDQRNAFFKASIELEHCARLTLLVAEKLQSKRLALTEASTSLIKTDFYKSLELMNITFKALWYMFAISIVISKNHDLTRAKIESNIDDEYRKICEMILKPYTFLDEVLEFINQDREIKGGSNR